MTVLYRLLGVTFGKKTKKMTTPENLEVGINPSLGADQQSSHQRDSSGCDDAAETNMSSPEESFDEKVLRMLDTLRQDYEHLSQQLNDKARLPANFLGNFVNQVEKKLDPKIEKLSGELMSLQGNVEKFEDTLKFTSDFVQKTEIEQVRILREENERLKEGITKKFTKRLLDEVIREIDEAEKTVKRLKGKKIDELTAENVLQASQSMVSDFRVMLQDRFDLTAYWTDAGEEINNDQHRVLPSKEITDDYNLDKKIARTLRCGYKDREGEIFRQETVVVYEYKECATPEENSSVVDTPATTPHGHTLDSAVEQETEQQNATI